MSTDSLAQFIQEVHQDYWAAPDKETQIHLAVELGSHLGYEFTEQEVEEYLNESVQLLTRSDHFRASSYGFPSGV